MQSVKKTKTTSWKPNQQQQKSNSRVFFWNCWWVGMKGHHPSAEAGTVSEQSQSRSDLSVPVEVWERVTLLSVHLLCPFLKDFPYLVYLESWEFTDKSQCLEFETFHCLAPRRFSCSCSHTRLLNSKKLFDRDLKFKCLLSVCLLVQANI